ncbi:hypothetical protein D3C87_1632650 [compost metagenome]
MFSFFELDFAKLTLGPIPVAAKDDPICDTISPTEVFLSDVCVLLCFSGFILVFQVKPAPMFLVVFFIVLSPILLNPSVRDPSKLVL